MQQLGVRRNWDEVRRFTPELYYEYCRAPIWEIDSPEFNSGGDYQGYWTKKAQDFVIASKSIIGRWQQRGKERARALENATGPSTPISDYFTAIADEPMPIAISHIHEKVALLSANPPIPTAVQTQEDQAPLVGACNQFMEMVYDDNNYDMVYSKAQYDAEFWNAACFKWTVNGFEPGIFAEPGRIVFEKCDLTKIFFDPKCKELHYSYMDYVVQKHEMEIGEIQASYPLVSEWVSADADERISDASVSSNNNEDYIQSPQPKLARDAAGHRQKITVLELWVKDSQLKFEPKLLSGEGGDYKNRFDLDEDGYIIGDWVKRYPDGRLLVCTGTVVLKDLPNPFPHGQFPFIFAVAGPADTPYSDGDAGRIMTVTRKINNTESSIHRYYQSEIPRPMHMTSGSLMDPNIQQNIPNDPTYALELAPSGSLSRPPAVDIPPLSLEYLKRLDGHLDTTAGSSGVMRGISDDAQLSGDTVNQLWQIASARLGLRAKFFNAAMRQAGYQLMWIIRGTVKQNIKVNVIQPDGSTLPIDWKSDRAIFERGDPTEIQRLRAKENYLIKIKAGTGKPGGAEAQQARALELFKENGINREALLDAWQWPNRQKILQQMRAEELENIQSKAEGRELGIAVGDVIKQQRPGRRNKPK